jgi:hypothetical protein
MEFISDYERLAHEVKVRAVGVGWQAILNPS